MSRNISVRGVRREPVDLARLAAAIAALAAENERRREAEEKQDTPSDLPRRAA